MSRKRIAIVLAVVMTAALALTGVLHNSGTARAEPDSEACCLPDDTCMDVEPSTCIGEGGVAQGPGTTCPDVDCEATATPTATAEPSPTPSPTPTEVTETPTPSPTPTIAPPPPTEETATPPPGPPVEETPRPVEPGPPPTAAPDEGDVIAPAPGTPKSIIAPPPTGAGSPSGGSWPWWPLAVAGAAAGAAGLLLVYQGRRAKS